MRPRRLAIGGALVALAAAAPLLWPLVSVTPTDVRVPLAAAPGGVARHAFVVEQEGPHQVRVALRRPPDAAGWLRAECLLGFDWTECADVVPAVRIRWRVQAEGGVAGCDGRPGGAGTGVERGVGGSLTADEMQRVVGCFHARAGTRYRLEVDTLIELAPVEDLRPALVVAPSAALVREGASVTGMVWLGALLAGLAGGAILLW